MARLIDADKLHFSPRFAWATPDREEMVPVLAVDKDWVDKAPTVDAVEVLRCKDCNKWGGVAFGNVCRRWSAPLAGMKNCTSADDFCSYGERRTNDT